MSTSNARQARRLNQRARSRGRHAGDLDPFMTVWLEVPPSGVPAPLRDQHPGAWEWLTASTALLGREGELATGIFPVYRCVQEAIREAAPVMAERAERALRADRLF